MHRHIFFTLYSLIVLLSSCTIVPNVLYEDLSFEDKQSIEQSKMNLALYNSLSNESKQEIIQKQISDSYSEEDKERWRSGSIEEYIKSIHQQKRFNFIDIVECKIYSQVVQAYILKKQCDELSTEQQVLDVEQKALNAKLQALNTDHQALEAKQQNLKIRYRILDDLSSGRLTFEQLKADLSQLLFENKEDWLDLISILEDYGNELIEKIHGNNPNVIYVYPISDPKKVGLENEIEKIYYISSIIDAAPNKKIVLPLSRNSREQIEEKTAKQTKKYAWLQTIFGTFNEKEYRAKLLTLIRNHDTLRLKTIMEYDVSGLDMIFFAYSSYFQSRHFINRTEELMAEIDKKSKQSDTNWTLFLMSYLQFVDAMYQQSTSPDLMQIVVMSQIEVDCLTEQLKEWQVTVNPGF